MLYQCWRTTEKSHWPIFVSPSPLYYLVPFYFIDFYRIISSLIRLHSFGANKTKRNETVSKKLKQAINFRHWILSVCVESKSECVCLLICLNVSVYLCVQVVQSDLFCCRCCYFSSSLISQRHIANTRPSYLLGQTYAEPEKDIIFRPERKSERAAYNWFRFSQSTPSQLYLKQSHNNK